MKIIRIKFILIVFLLLAQISSITYSQDQIVLSENKVDSLLSLISIYEYGMDRAPLSELSDMILENFNSSGSNFDFETKIINFLNSKATFDGKQFICRELSLIGTNKSVDVLITMLLDKNTSDMARFALEKIKDESVNPRLIAALDDADKNTKIGIINTLAVRKSELVIDKLGKYVLDSDNEIADAAASALGKISCEKSAKIISGLLGKTEGRIHNELLDSYLICADKYLIENKAAAASNIYSYVLENEKASNRRIAALKGIIISTPENRASTIVKTLKGNEYLLKEVAIENIRDFNSSAEFEQISNNFNSFDEKSQIQIIYAIKESGLSFFHNLIDKIAETGSTNLRVAAISCLEKIGNVNDVELLARLALNKIQEIQAAARETIDNMLGKDTDLKILELIPISEPETQVEFIRSAGERMIQDGFNLITKTARSENQKVRIESYKTLGMISNPAQLEKLMEVFLAIEHPAELKRMETTLVRVSLKNENQNERADIFLNSFDKTEDIEKKMSLLRILCNTGDNRALKYIRSSLNSENDAISKTAIQSLYNWPNLEPLNDLLEIVKTSANSTHQILALRSYINLIKAQGLNSDSNLVNLYKTALTYAKSNEEKIMIISGAGTVQSLEALNFVSAFLEDVSLRPEAEAACFEIIDRVRWSQPSETIKVLEKIVKNPSSNEVEKQAKQLISDIK